MGTFESDRSPAAAPAEPGCCAPALELVHAGAAEATVVTPPDGSLDGEARRVVAAIQARFGVALAIVTGDRALRKLSTRHAIALGCLADNPFVEALYYRWHTLVDRWYPGSGGWVVQTIPSPYRRGHHVLLLGGSDQQGVGAATGRFAAHLERSRSGWLPWRLELHLGAGHLPLPEDRLDCLGTAASPIPTPESALPDAPYVSGFAGGSARDHLLRLGMFGPHADNAHLSRSSQLGLRYLYTGRAEDARRYRRALLAEARSGVIRRLYHYKSLRMFQLWALLGASPVFADPDREEIATAIRGYLLEESGVASIEAIRQASTGEGIFNRHLACDALNLWAGADWLWRETGQPRWREDRAVADAYFEAQAGTDVPLTGLTEGYASYLEVYLEWMLLSCPRRIARDAHIRLWARRLLGLCTNTGQLVLGPQTDASRYPYHLLRKLAYLLADGRYLFAADLRERQVRRGMDRVLQFSAGQAYAGDVHACEPGDGPGLITYPLNERLRRWQAPSIPADTGFDRAVARGGWDEGDDYLMVIGVRSGAKSLPNVGALAAYERFGQRLITSAAVALYPHSASPWRHSTVTVSAGGLGGGMAAGAEVLARSEVAGGHVLSFRIHIPGLCRWTRRLYWRPAAYVLVVDRVVVDRADPFTVGVNWRCAGPVVNLDGNLATLDLGAEVAGRFYVEVCAGLHLEAETNAYPVPGGPRGTPPQAEVMLHATMDCPGPVLDRRGHAGDHGGPPVDHHGPDMDHRGQDGEIEVATLLHAVAGATDPCYRLCGGGAGWIVEGPEETLACGRGSGEGEMAIEVRVQTRRTSGRRRESAPAHWTTFRRDRTDGYTCRRGAVRSRPAGVEPLMDLAAVHTPHGAAGAPGSRAGRGASARRLPTRWAFELPQQARLQAPAQVPAQAWSRRTAQAATQRPAQAPTQISAWAQSADGAVVALGTEGGFVALLDAAGTPRWTRWCDGAVTALTLVDGDVIVGTRSGQVCRLGEGGTAQWQHRCRFRPERTFWPWWFLETPAVGALAAGRDPAAAGQVVAVGTGSTGLEFLEAGSGALRADALSPFGWPDRIRAHRSARSGRLRFLVGHSWLTCGSTLRAWDPDPRAGAGIRYYRSVNPMGRTLDEWDTCGLVDAWVGPLVRGLPERVVVLRHGAVNQLTVYDEASGDPLWDAGLGGAPVALAVMPGAAAVSARCHVADQLGWLVGFDGDGTRVLATHIASSLQGMQAGAAGRLALWNMEDLHLTRGDHVTDRYPLEGPPLGWYGHPQHPGLLCLEGERVVMKEVAGWQASG